MHKTTVSSVGGIISAIVASLCCIGPVVLALLGVGSIGLFSTLEPYRPYLIGLTVVLIGFAFYLTYRKREVICEDGTCRIEGASKWNKVAVWLVTVAAAAAIAFPYLGLQPTAAVNPAVPSEAVAVLQINGMDCPACAAGVEGMLASIKGVHQAKVDFDKEQATIEYEPNVVSAQTFVNRVNETRYEATLVSH